MLIVKNLTVTISGEPLFEKVSFVVGENDRIGIVGPNGSGKSTLIKTILGEVEPDKGSVSREQERIGYLPQEFERKGANTIGEYLSEHPKVAKILKEVGLINFALETLIQNLSGGQKTRLALAKVLLDGPTILLMDEPTNHLDIKGLEWLEEFIQNFRGGVMIISHDRKLLDTVVNKIFEIDRPNKSFKEYAGGFSEYLVEREHQHELQENAYNLQQKEKRRMEEWLALKKQEAKIHADPAKGKQIRAMEKRLQREIYDQEILKPKDFREIKALELRGHTPEPKLIVRCTNVTKGFDGKTVLRPVSFEIRGKERVLIAGRNGSGKTTLLKAIVGEIAPDDGEVKIGEAVRIAYFAQEHENLDPNKTVIEEFEANMTHSQDATRHILGSFLFSGESVFKKVSSLSLGERVRLIFAKFTHESNHLLVLDEPTNHLDIQTRQIIENALMEYQGAILAVSHDRYFIDTIGFSKTITLINVLSELKK